MGPFAEANSVIGRSSRLPARLWEISVSAPAPIRRLAARFNTTTCASRRDEESLPRDGSLSVWSWATSAQTTSSA